MAKRFSVTDRDRGFRRFMQNAKALGRKPFVKVGLPESADAPKEGADGALTLVQVATFHEFGTERVPERSFLRLAVTQNRRAIDAFIAKLRDDVLVSGQAGNALRLIGEFVQAKVQEKIQSGDAKWPALSPRTIEAKGSSRPLIDTGQLVQSIRYEVVENP